MGSDQLSLFRENLHQCVSACQSYLFPYARKMVVCIETQVKSRPCTFLNGALTD